MQGRLGWGELCPGERSPWNGDDAAPPGPPAPGPLGYSSGLEVSKVPTAEEIQMTWSLLALGLELGGRSGKSAVFSLVGNKLE